MYSQCVREINFKPQYLTKDSLLGAACTGAVAKDRRPPFWNGDSAGTRRHILASNG